MWAKELNRPKIFRSQRTTAITTTAFKIDLIVPCMGIRLTSHSSTPTTIRTIITVINGIGFCPPLVSRRSDFSRGENTRRGVGGPYMELRRGAAEVTLCRRTRRLLLFRRRRQIQERRQLL